MNLKMKFTNPIDFYAKKIERGIARGVQKIALRDVRKQAKVGKRSWFMVSQEKQNKRLAGKPKAQQMLKSVSPWR